MQEVKYFKAKKSANACENVDCVFVVFASWITAIFYQIILESQTCFGHLLRNGVSFAKSSTFQTESAPFTCIDILNVNFQRFNFKETNSQGAIQDMSAETWNKCLSRDIVCFAQSMQPILEKRNKNINNNATSREFNL